MQREININTIQDSGYLALQPATASRVFYYVSKRVIDVVISAIALIVLLPVMIIVAFLIKLDSAGPILFKQNRVGACRRNANHHTYWQNVTFQCYKFRTMICNADPSLHQSFVRALIHDDCDGMAQIQGSDTQLRKLAHDPRITRVGKILRKCSIDELPQFFNILKGDMSLVGPRPAIPYEVEMYKPWHYQRLNAQPGITGLWQVTARSTASFDEMINLDIQYIKQQSFWLDIAIILITPFAILSCKGAE
jgi:lipopolysaccharide/colanic/teichoic acid biosynthesis glycosyltransferase